MMNTTIRILNTTIVYTDQAKYSVDMNSEQINCIMVLYTNPSTQNL